MADRESVLLNGGEDFGMTDSQYKGMLIDQRKLLVALRKMAEDAGNAEIIQKLDIEIEAINQKLEI